MNSGTLSFQTQSGASGEFIPQPNNWVKLRDRLSPISHDEALLLCEAEGDRWTAWVPDHGEVVLHRSQFVAE